MKLCTNLARVSNDATANDPLKNVLERNNDCSSTAAMQLSCSPGASRMTVTFGTVTMVESNH